MRDSFSIRDEISDPSFLIFLGALTAEIGLSSEARWLRVQELEAPKQYVEEKDEQRNEVAIERVVVNILSLWFLGFEIFFCVSLCVA